MRLEWLEDIVAVIETGSFSAAAERRCLTQPAFSRRVRAIEAYVGTELFDRGRKPVRLKPGVADRQDDIRRLVGELKDLLYEFRRQEREVHNRIVIASQHAITATRAPAIVNLLSQRMDISVRLRSANRDECLSLLMNKQADLVLNYQSQSEAASDPGDLLERTELGDEQFIPVFAAAQLDWLNRSFASGELPIVAYPNDAFLGRLFNEELLPKMSHVGFVRRKVETALTLAALQFAMNGIGVAWVPRSIAVSELDSGSLVDLSRGLPASTLATFAVRLSGNHAATEEMLWSALADQLPDETDRAVAAKRAETLVGAGELGLGVLHPEP